MGRVLFLAMFLLPAFWPGRFVSAQMGQTAQQSLSQSVRQMLLDSLPEQFEETKDWGATKDVTVGYKVKTHDWNVKFEKRKKRVNHGLWKKYRVTPIDPQSQLKVRVENLRSAGAGKVAATVLLSAPLHVEARMERWRQGIKMLNFSTEADCRVQVRVDCELAVRFDPGRFLHDVVVEPRVTGVRLDLVHFDLQRVSKLDGWAAHELGNGLKDIVAEQLHRREPKIVEKLNRAIGKNQDRLRFSPDKLLASGWSNVQSLLGVSNRP